jgi:hypothetical protein
MPAATPFIADPGRALAFAFLLAALALSAFFWLTENWGRLRDRRESADELARGLRERMNRLRGRGPFGSSSDDAFPSPSHPRATAPTADVRPPEAPAP